MDEFSGIPADSIEQAKIFNARAMSPERKLRVGLELFDLNRALILAALKARFPDADPARLNELFRRRLAAARRLDAMR